MPSRPAWCWATRSPALWVRLAPTLSVTSSLSTTITLLLQGRLPASRAALACHHACGCAPAAAAAAWLAGGRAVAGSAGVVLPQGCRATGPCADMRIRVSRTAPGAPIPMRTWEPGRALASTRARAPRAGSVWGWRWPFVLVALPALAAAALMLGTTREPPRGCTEAALSVRRPCPGHQPTPRRAVALEHRFVTVTTRDALAAELCAEWRATTFTGQPTLRPGPVPRRARRAARPCTNPVRGQPARAGRVCERRLPVQRAHLAAQGGRAGAHALQPGGRAAGPAGLAALGRAHDVFQRLPEPAEGHDRAAGHQRARPRPRAPQPRTPPPCAWPRESQPRPRATAQQARAEQPGASRLSPMQRRWAWLRAGQGTGTGAPYLCRVGALVATATSGTGPKDRDA